MTIQSAFLNCSLLKPSKLPHIGSEEWRGAKGSKQNVVFVLRDHCCLTSCWPWLVQPLHQASLPVLSISFKTKAVMDVYTGLCTT